MRLRFSMVAATIGLAAIALAALAGGFVGSANALPSTVVVVTPSAADGWTYVQQGTCGSADTGSQGFVTGPGSPPAGAGSFEMTVGSDGDSFQGFGTTSFGETKLADLTTLSYSTYVSQPSTGGGDQQAPYMNIRLDLDGNGSPDDRFFFEPTYSSGGYGGDPVAPQPPIADNVWQTWDALHGGWWSANDGFGGPPLHTLQQILLDNPNATIVNGPNAGIKINVGCGGGAWQGFIGNFDNVTVGINSADTTYDFEPDPACTLTCYVNSATGNDSNGGSTPASAKKTIQAAVTQVSPTGAVIVAAGAYAESVAVGKAVTINGAQAGAAVAGRTFGSVTESTVTGQFTVTAANATLDGFSITSPGLNIGVYLKNAADNALVKNDIFDTIGSAAAPDPVQAIYLENGPDNVTVLNNRISNVQSVKSAKGVYVGDTVATDASSGAVIQGNSISGIKSGLKGAYGIQANNKIGMVNAVISGNTIDGLMGRWAHAIGLEGETPNVNVNHNVISNLTDAGAGKIAVWFEANTAFASAHVNRNSLAVGSAAGIFVHPSLGAGPVDGTCNWWGDSTGPAPGGSGSPIGPSVTFNPWLMTSDLDGTCNGGTPRGTKQSVLAELQAYPSVGKETDKKIKEAIDHLTKSLAPGLWVDDSHILKDKVFNEEKETVKKLGDIKNASPSLAASIDGWVASLVAADRSLATTAIAEWTGSAKELAKANEELAKGDAEAAAGKFDKAIDRYKGAWKTVKP